MELYKECSIPSPLEDIERRQETSAHDFPIAEDENIVVHNFPIAEDENIVVHDFPIAEDVSELNETKLCMHFKIMESIHIPTMEEVLCFMKQIPLLATLIPFFCSMEEYQPEYIAHTISCVPEPFHIVISFVMAIPLLIYLSETSDFFEIIKIYCKGKIPHGEVLSLITDFAISSIGDAHDFSIVPFSFFVDILRYHLSDESLTNDLVDFVLSISEDANYCDKIQLHTFLFFAIQDIPFLLPTIEWEIVATNIGEKTIEIVLNPIIDLIQNDSDFESLLDEEWIKNASEIFEENFGHDFIFQQLLSSLTIE